MCLPGVFLKVSWFLVVLRFKLLKWWAQSFLLGVPRVIAGFRTHDGVVIALETISVSEISHIIKVFLSLFCQFLGTKL